MGSKEISKVAGGAGLPAVSAIEAAKLLTDIIDCYKCVTIAKEEQLTKRMMIREQARVCLAAIEGRIKEFEEALERAKIERDKLLDLLCEIVRKGDCDSNTLDLCKYILDNLDRGNPMRYINL